MGERSTRLIVAGAAVLVACACVAAALWFASRQRLGDNVAAFARAPAGCDTTLDFASTGVFVLYLETTGRLDDIEGECDAPARYERDRSDVPEVSIALRDPQGVAVELRTPDEISYDVDGFVGSALWVVSIERPGVHMLTVASSEGVAVAVAVGRSPDDGVAALRAASGGAIAVGLLLGGVLLIFGSRRRPAPAAPPVLWTPDESQRPLSPPGFPMPPPTTGAVAPPGATPWAPPPARKDGPR